MIPENPSRGSSDATSRRAGMPPEMVGGRYRVEQTVGVGGMATVYRATDLKHQRNVALKILSAALYDSTGAQRFLREITIAANLTHPHILPLHDSGEVDGLLYYVMPFVDGPTLRAKLRTEGTIAVGEAVRILRDVADALGAAHAQGVIHRDIKPENIMMLGRSAVVTDFGVAKALTAATGGKDAGLTATGVTAGTPAYMAPEQLAADPSIDQRADLYSLGVVAYELLTGTAPFAGRTPTQLAAAIMTEEPPPLAAKRPDLPPALTALVTRLLAKDPMSRPATAAQVVDAFDALEITSPTVAGQPRRARALVRWRTPILAVAVVLATAAGIYAMRRAAAPAAASADALGAFWAGGSATSVAVLPFNNTSGDTANEHFSDGLTDELSSALEKVAGLRVAALASVFALKHTSLTLRAQAETLKVAALIEGGVRRDGGRIKVHARLWRAKDDSTLWSESYDRKVGDLFAVQEEIAGAIVSALHARPRGSVAPTLVRIPTRNLAAHELYLRGIHDDATRGPKGVLMAIDELRQATQLDTAFAMAFAALSDAYVHSSAFGLRPPQVALPLAEAAADRAIALDPSLSAAFASKGFILMQRRSFADAGKAMRRAIELQPGYAAAHHYYSLWLALEGRTSEAQREVDKSIVLDPLSGLPNVHRGVLALLNEDRAGARRKLETAALLNPDQLSYYWLGIAQVADGQFADGAASLERARNAAHTFPGIRSTLAYTYTRLGRKADADALMASLGTDSNDRLERALGDAMTGNIDRAYAVLRGGAWKEGSISVIQSVMNLRANPMLAQFRADSRYAGFLRELGLEP